MINMPTIETQRIIECGHIPLAHRTLAIAEACRQAVRGFRARGKGANGGQQKTPNRFGVLDGNWGVAGKKLVVPEQPESKHALIQDRSVTQNPKFKDLFGT